MLYPAKTFFKIIGEIRKFRDKQKFKQIMTTKLVHKQKQPESKTVKEKEERHLHPYVYMGYDPSLQ